LQLLFSFHGEIKID